MLTCSTTTLRRRDIGAVPFTHVPSLLVRVIIKIRHTRYSSWRRNFSHNSLFCQIPSVSLEERPFPVSSAVKLQKQFTNSRNNLPPLLSRLFKKTDEISLRHTRTSKYSNLTNKYTLYIPRFHTARLQRRNKYRGVKIWNEISLN